jgi:hypothetical protein
METWRAADSHDFDEEQGPDPHPLSGKSDSDPHSSENLDPDPQ